ncbi:hypothetical protein MMC07_008691 [Pseudocyphellaria aurata]|nr:hypothetical protein [Pseudocyphellaria aurata]
MMSQIDPSVVHPAQQSQGLPEYIASRKQLTNQLTWAQNYQALVDRFGLAVLPLRDLSLQRTPGPRTRDVDGKPRRTTLASGLVRNPPRARRGRSRHPDHDSGRLRGLGGSPGRVGDGADLGTLTTIRDDYGAWEDHRLVGYPPRARRGRSRHPGHDPGRLRGLGGSPPGRISASCAAGPVSAP